VVFIIGKSLAQVHLHYYSPLTQLTTYNLFKSSSTTATHAAQHLNLRLRVVMT
jgi:hypothetical protein